MADRAQIVRRRLALAGTAAAIVVVAIAFIAPLGGEDHTQPPQTKTPADAGRDRPPAKPPQALTPLRPYQPIGDEEFPNGKRTAARIAEAALTYDRGASAAGQAAQLDLDRETDRATAQRALLPLIAPEASSAAQAIYPQLSGSTPTSLGVMVVTRQRIDQAGERRESSHTLDIRLRRSGNGPWRLARIGADSPPPSPSSPAKGAAAALLSNPRVDLSGSAREDVASGRARPKLIDALAQASRSHRIRIAVIRTGHPANVWASGRPSAHAAGQAADIWAVDDKPVIAQRDVTSAAHDLAVKLLERDPGQIGSPWNFDGASRTSFTDAVHQDHIHIEPAD